VSPLLWNSSGGKSAGRVQSSTLHLICEREKERLAFKPEDYWVLQAHYESGFTSQFEPKGPPGTKPDKNKVRSESEALRIKETACKHSHIVTNIDSREEKRFPPPPLITSSLQQSAGARLKYSPQKTMKIAQELYEGIKGNGLITYMRTDAITLSPEFVQDARTWLKQNAPEALAEKPPVFKVKAEAQGAHEAIRPTSASLTPQKAGEILNAEQLAVYRLIWERAMASQCRPARLSRGQIEIHAGDTRWIARGLTVAEAGYLSFWRNIEEEKELPKFSVGQVLRLSEVVIEAKKTQPPSRYSEPKLIELMEKLGIGRPSTYASTMTILRERDYVILEKGLMLPTELGMATDEVLAKAMPDLVNVQFTANMENSLDQIAKGKIGWEAFLCDWNGNYLHAALSKARELIRTLPMKAKVAPPSTEGRGATRRRKASKRPSGQKMTSGRPGGKVKRRFTGKLSKTAATLASPPDCSHGHGPLEARISKKGDPYWKCHESDCDS